MNVLNVHERMLPTPQQQVGALLDMLATARDALWPRHSWPRMEFDRPIGVGASGGHGPIRYLVEDYSPAGTIRFRFTSPAGFDGFHAYEVVAAAAGGGAVLRHTLIMTTRGLAALSWPVIYRPLHDALIADSLCVAQAASGQPPRIQAWSRWVKFLRFVASGGRARPQLTPDVAFKTAPDGTA